MRKLLAVIALCFIASSAQAACSGATTTWTCPAGSSNSDIQTAVNNASNAATITLAAGTYNSFSDPVYLDNTKGVTIICASVGGCTMPQTRVYFAMAQLCNCTNANLYRISGFNFSAAAAPVINFSSSNSQIGFSVYQKVRIDHNTFTTAGIGNGYFINWSDQSTAAVFYGVTDHNTVNAAGSYGIAIHYGAQPATYPAAAMGTANNMFYEDNVINNTAMTDSGGGCLDVWTGAVVWRYNTSTNCLVHIHGVTHNGGHWNFEVYHNSVIQNANSMFPDCYRCIADQGSGTDIFWSNALTTSMPVNPSAIEVLNYRDYGPPPSPNGSIEGTIHFGDGLQMMDGNRSPTATYRGYPLWHQPGRDFFFQYAPMVAWGNTANGSKIDLLVPDGGFGTPDYQPQHFVVNRDYFNAVSANAQTSSTSPFNGTTGAGFGTTARRPTTCTTSSETGLGAGNGGVMYFKTDSGSQGSLDTCSGTNVWSSYYTPYTYPHPLVSGGGGGGTADVTPGSISFGFVTVGMDSASQTITVTNSGSATTTISSIALVGGIFTLTNSGGGSCSALSSGHLTAGSNCTVSLKGHPTNPNYYTCTVTVTSDAPSSPTVINCDMTGIPATTHTHSAPIIIGGTPGGSVTVALTNEQPAGTPPAPIALMRDGVALATLPSNALSYVDTNVSSGKTYHYTATTGDSPVSNSVAVTVPNVGGPTFTTGDSFQVVTGGGRLNVRSTPTVTAPVVATLANGFVGTITGGPSNSFWQMAKGWVASQFIRQ